MNWLTYASWLAGPLLQITLLVFMVRNKFHVEFPRFFSYILFQILKSACLFVAYRYFAHSYFEAYWTGNALSLIFAVAVMDEILRSLFKEYGGIQSLGTTIFRWSSGLLLLLAIISALSSSEAGGDGILDGVLAFDRSMRLMQVGLFLLLMLLSRVLKNCWRQPVFGIALGFGVFASIELILLSLVMWHGSNGHAPVFSLVKSMAYNAITIVWIGYLRQQPHLVPRVEGVAHANPLGFAFAGSAAVSHPDDGFMLRVEQAVDRVLSRSDWPRPATKGSRVVGRKPNPEEGN
jgi:hypothetical protein